MILLCAVSLLILGCEDKQKPVSVSKFEKWDPTKNEGKGDWVAYDQKERFKHKFCTTIKFKLTLDVDITKDEQITFSTEKKAGWTKEMTFDPKSIDGPKKGKVEVLISLHFPDVEPWDQPPNKAKGDYEIEVQAVTVTTDTNVTEKGRVSVKIPINVDN